MLMMCQISIELPCNLCLHVEQLWSWNPGTIMVQGTSNKGLNMILEPHKKHWVCNILGSPPATEVCNNLGGAGRNQGGFRPTPTMIQILVNTQTPRTFPGSILYAILGEWGTQTGQETLRVQVPDSRIRAETFALQLRLPTS